ncbi:MAG: L,D-transpeptidase [Verrucomicrobiota bacterium]
MSSSLPKLPTTILLLASLSFGALAEEEKKTENPVAGEAIEAVTRLQIFLDKAEFAPGKIDGRIGQFTLEALALYRQAQGGAVTPTTPDPKVKVEKGDALPDLSDLDLTTADPLFLTYEVSEEDLKQVGELPSEIPEQAKLKALPYRSAAEAIAEKFHMDAGYLEELNPGKTKNIKAGDLLKVVNVVPFEKSAIDALKEKFAQDKDEADSNKNDDAEAKKENDSKLIVHINTEINMLTVFENDKLVAAYPVTVGSGQTESPVGKWKVTKISTMPNFRHDKSMLKEGVRSDDFHMLSPGPNNPVGVMWIQLSKDGIGIHGTNDPDTIGRASSHGCIRLANWDVVRFAEKIGLNVPVTIQAGPR